MTMKFSAALLALLVIYALLAVPLQSYMQPLIIMSVIPFGAVGAVLGHYLLGMDLVFFSLLGIEDSTNGEFDRFYISFYNGNDELLGAIAFDNTPADFGVLRYDGNQLVHTGEIFVNNTVQGLFVSIDYLTNTWSAKYWLSSQ